MSESIRRGIKTLLPFALAASAIACQDSPNGSTALVQLEAPRHELESATDSHPHSFELIAAIRELDDRRVLVSDERATRLYVADFDSGSVHDVGRIGQGPGEYRQTGRLWAAAGDTTIHKEPYAPRLLVLAGTEVVQTVGGTDVAVRQLGATPIHGVDTLGRAVISVMDRGTSAVDSLLLVRVDWRSGQADTITRVQSQEGWSVQAGVAEGPAGMGVPAAGGGTGPSERATFRMSIFAPDQVAVMPSGWIAIVRAQPYRVDWCSPGGECAEGPTIQSGSQELTDADKQLYLRRAAATSSWPPTENIEETAGWPRTLPPFTLPSSRLDAAAVIAAPGQRVLIERTYNDGSLDTRYDVVDREAGLVAWFELPPTDRVAGFGSGHVYVVRTTEDGWQLLRRHPWGL